MTVGELVRIEAILFISGIAIAVFWKLVTGTITMRGLLTDEISGQFSPARLQLMLAALLGAGFYAGELGQITGPAWPEPSAELLAIIGVSNLIHLGAKSWNLIKLARTLRS